MPERIENLYGILDFCADNNITPVLITTPYTSLYSDMVSEEFKAQFYDTIAKISEETGTSYYD